MSSTCTRANSFDAFTVGVGQTWERAYRFAMGEEVELSTTGEKMQRTTPYDFVAITDHSEYYGVLKDFKDPKSELSKSDFAKKVVAGLTDPSKAGEAVTKLIGSPVTNTPLSEYVTPELRVENWQKSFDSIYPEDLWTYLEVQRNQGIETFAIWYTPPAPAATK